MGTSSFSQQLKALLKKNFLIKLRNKKQTIYECIAPIYFVLIISGVKLGISPDKLPEIESFPEYSLSPFTVPYESVLYVSPDEPRIHNVVDELLTHINVSEHHYFASADEAYEHYKDSVGEQDNAIGIHFTDGQLNNVSYTLRFPFSKLPDSGKKYSPPAQCREEGTISRINCDANQYIFSGFVHLQTVINWLLSKEITGIEDLPRPDYSFEQMAKPSHLPDIMTIQLMSSIYLVLAYSPFILSLTVNLVTEKEKKIKEGMRMMGMQDAAFWFSWGLLYVGIIALVTIVVSSITFAIKFFENSNFLLIFLLLFLYGMSIVNMAFVFTPFFSKAQVAGAVASFATLLLSLLYLVVSLTRTMGDDGPESTIPSSAQWFLCLLSPVAFALGIDRALYLDISEGGLTFSTVNDGQFSLGNSLVMLAVDCVLYALLAFWLDSIVPNEHGLRRPPWFCFTSSYWCGSKRSETLAASPYEDSSNQLDSSNIEPVSSDLSGSNHLRIHNIRKTYKTKTGTINSVDGITLDLYEGQITALLGHNGAGKTTLINMLTGMAPPTKGTATIYGLDVSNSNDMVELRKITGVCPQHDVLFDDLSCAEHLELFGALKGIPASELKQQVTTSLSEVDLTPQAAARAKTLSGGQKRKLSLAIALIGDPKVVFLDEPTAGMDPYSRRHVWSVLKNRRAGKLILLTTHFMDEADILADRKAFISQGRLQCVGSSLFLKNKFGLGYHLGMVLEDRANIDKISEVVRCYLGEDVVFRQHGQELTYTLPLNAVQSFPDLFSDLESIQEDTQKSTSLGISTYGISMTTLEEVFLKLGDGVENRDNEADTNIMDLIRHTTVTASERHQRDNADTATGFTNLHTDNGVHNNGSTVDINMDPALLEQPEQHQGNTTIEKLIALQKIKWKITFRNKKKLVAQVIMPIVFVIAGCTLLRFVQQDYSPVEDPMTLPINHQLYSQDHSGHVIPLALSNHSVAQSMLDSFTDALTSQAISYTPMIDFSNLLEVVPHHEAIDIRHLIRLNNILFSQYTMVYNDTCVHSLPVIVNDITNTQLVMDNYPADLLVFSHPWPSHKSELPPFDGALFGSVMILGFSMAIMPAGFAIAHITEREKHIRSQLRIAGVSSSLYWIGAFIADIAVFSVPAVISLVVLVAFQTRSIMYPGAVGSIILLYIFYMPSNMLFAYAFSFAFSKAETAETLLGNLFSFMGFVPYIVISIVDMSGHFSTAETIHYVCVCVDPLYGVFGGLYYIIRIYLTASILGKEDDIQTRDYFAWDSNIPICYIAPVLHFVVFGWLLRILEVRSTGGSGLAAFDSVLASCGVKRNTSVDAHHDSSSLDQQVTNEDSDVAALRQRLNQYEPIVEADNQPVVVVRRLRKEFKKAAQDSQNNGGGCFKSKSKEEKVHVAVCNNTFSVEEGEVLGLLGPNGAGKTTTLNMIMAEVSPTCGQVYVNGYDVKSNLSEAFQSMGYCPQHNAQWDDITLQEHLQCYAVLSGVPKAHINTVVDYYINNLKVDDHAKKIAKALSGGTKRKLSFAMSMLGYPKIVLLDEPSTGMDPKSKRFLWDTISGCFKNSNRGAILTTHYMDEADALCSTIAIMINGQMECYGSGQHLKSKFGTGYLLEVKLLHERVVSESPDGVEAMDALGAFVTGLFPGASLMESFAERAIYKIPQDNVTSLAKTFRSLEEGRDKVGIEEYSFSQSTLEQVFLEFARRQHDEGDSPQQQHIQLDQQATNRQAVNV